MWAVEFVSCIFIFTKCLSIYEWRILRPFYGFLFFNYQDILCLSSSSFFFGDYWTLSLSLSWGWKQTRGRSIVPTKISSTPVYLQILRGIKCPILWRLSLNLISVLGTLKLGIWQYLKGFVFMVFYGRI